MVRGVPNTVLEGRGRRQRKITKDLVDNYILNSKPVGSSVCTRGNSGKNGDRASFNRILRGNLMPVIVGITQKRTIVMTKVMMMMNVQMK